MGGGDILFTTLERWQEGRSWGRLLDAGTGVNSLKWIVTLDTISWDAITADEMMKNEILSNQEIRLRSEDSLLVGNWMDDHFCQQLGKYDTILADYLIGAVDGFSPYTQDIIIERLKKHLNPGGSLYIIGMQPIPDTIMPPQCIVSEVRRVRDACILLAGHRPYREYPLEWMERYLHRNGFVINQSKCFTILHTSNTLLRQIRVAEGKLSLMANQEMRNGMRSYLDDLKSRVKDMVNSTSDGKIPLSYDYCIRADLPLPGSLSQSFVSTSVVADQPGASSGPIEVPSVCLEGISLEEASNKKNQGEVEDTR